MKKVKNTPSVELPDNYENKPVIRIDEPFSKYTFGVVRRRYVYDSNLKQNVPYFVIHHFSPIVGKEDHTKLYLDGENWLLLEDALGMDKISWTFEKVARDIINMVDLFNLIYDSDLEYSGWCEGSRCEGYDIVLEEWYFKDELELFDKIREIFER